MNQLIIKKKQLKKKPNAVFR